VVAGAISSAFLFGRTAQRRKGVDPLALGDRPKILKQLEQSAIIPHVAEADSTTYPYEVCTFPSKYTATPALSCPP
jgi:hypothetical protein